MENLCRRVSVTLGQCSSNSQNYAIVCPNIYDVIRKQRYLSLYECVTFSVCLCVVR